MHLGKEETKQLYERAVMVIYSSPEDTILFLTGGVINMFMSHRYFGEYL